MHEIIKEQLETLKSLAVNGKDLSFDQYHAILTTCRETAAWDETGKLARVILYILSRNGWKQLKYVSNRNYIDEEYYADQGCRV